MGLAESSADSPSAAAGKQVMVRRSAEYTSETALANTNESGDNIPDYLPPHRCIQSADQRLALLDLNTVRLLATAAVSLGDNVGRADLFTHHEQAIVVRIQRRQPSPWSITTSTPDPGAIRKITCPGYCLTGAPMLADQPASHTMSVLRESQSDA